MAGSWESLKTITPPVMLQHEVTYLRRLFSEQKSAHTKQENQKDY